MLHRASRAGAACRWALIVPAVAIAGCRNEDEPAARDNGATAAATAAAPVARSASSPPAASLPSVGPSAPSVPPPSLVQAAGNSGDSTEVHVLDRGATPRRTLAYSFATGQRDRLRFTLRMTTSRDMPQMSVPVVSGRAPELVTFDVVSAAPQSPGHPRFWIAAVPPDDGKAPSDGPAAQVAHSLDGLRAAIDLDAASGGVRIFFAEGYTPRRDSGELLAALRLSLESLFVPLPAGALGRGAKWERVVRTTDEGVPTSTTTTYSLKDLAQGSAVVTVSSRRDSPRAAGGSEAGDLAVEGTYVQTMRFDRLPERVSGEWVTTVSLGPAKPPSRPPQAKTVVSELVESLGS